MSTFAIVAIALAITGLAWNVARKIWMRPTPPIEKLKNALLAHALMRTQNVDEGLNMRYDEYDGSQLPHFSGNDRESACWSYIVPLLDQVRSPFFTVHMMQKGTAIDKYLRGHISTHESARHCFHKYLQTLDLPVATPASDLDESVDAQQTEASGNVDGVPASGTPDDTSTSSSDGLDPSMWAQIEHVDANDALTYEELPEDVPEEPEVAP